MHLHVSVMIWEYSFVNNFKCSSSRPSCTTTKHLKCDKTCSSLDENVCVWLGCHQTTKQANCNGQIERKEEESKSSLKWFFSKLDYPKKNPLFRHIFYKMWENEKIEKVVNTTIAPKIHRTRMLKT